MTITKFKVAFATCFGAMGAILWPWLGGLDKMLTALLGLMAADYITGLIVAGVFKASPKSSTGGLESRAGLKGIFRKIAMLVGVFLAVQLDMVSGVAVTRGFVIMFFVANEGLSIVENIVLMGVPMPGFLTKMLEVMREKSGAGETEGK